MGPFNFGQEISRLSREVGLHKCLTGSLDPTHPIEMLFFNDLQSVSPVEEQQMFE